MSDINSLNAVTREQARIREAVVAIPVHPMYHNPPFGSSANPKADPYIKRSEVLAILNGAGTLATVQDESTIKPVRKIPWEVRAEINKLGDHTFFESKGKVDMLISRNEVLQIVTKYER